MIITHVKDLNVYTSKRITSYEFERMRGVERLYVWVCTGLGALILALCVCIVVLSEKTPPRPLETLKSGKRKAVVMGKVTGEATLEGNYPPVIDYGWERPKEAR